MSDKRDSVQFSRLVVSDSLQIQVKNIETLKFSILGLGRSPIYFLLELAFTIISYFYFFVKTRPKLAGFKNNFLGRSLDLSPELT